MPPKKKQQHKPTRLQPRRATRDSNKKDRANAKEPAVSRPPKNGLRKAARKSGSHPTRQRKKLQQALIKKVDARDPKDSWNEQAGLLGLIAPSSPISTKSARSPGVGRHGSIKDKKYVDSILNNETDGLDNDPNDDLKRAQRWIPDFEHRRKPLERPAGIPHALWMAYKHLDELVYRYSLSREELHALPLLADVHDYQDMDGRTQRPVTPPGFRWDDNLELTPLG